VERVAQAVSRDVWHAHGAVRHDVQLRVELVKASEQLANERDVHSRVDLRGVEACHVVCQAKPQRLVRSKRSALGFTPAGSYERKGTQGHGQGAKRRVSRHTIPPG
jgi:hypothetical protein